jgi:glutamine amidotransferase
MDLGIGNIYSIICALKKLGVDTKIFSSTQKISCVDAVVLPGVGNFTEGAQKLQNMRKEILRKAEEGVPLFGICLGMHFLFEFSEEGPGYGLKILKGKVLKLPNHVKIPHMGWNTLKIRKTYNLLDYITKDDYFYFVHSYYPNPLEKSSILAETEYGLQFASVISMKNVFGVQFHPEKSGKPGNQLLKNFLNIIKK